MRTLRLFVGTSGWSYDHWRGAFYPEKLDPREWFEYYAERFRTVELNVTFYRLPFANMIRSWRERAPSGFLFAVKGWRRITHLKRLREIEDDLAVFLERAKGLGEHLGPVLWQLPPSLHKDEALLRDFVDRLPSEYRHVIEFRHPSWLDEPVFNILRDRNVACAWISSQRMPFATPVTADFLYLRFHGLEGGFAHDYRAEELRPWVEAVVGSRRRTVFAYFNNDAAARAPENAKAFLRALERRYQKAQSPVRRT